MNALNKSVSLFLVLFLSFACKRPAENNGIVQKIEINPEEISDDICLSTIAKTSLVPLSTSDTVLVGEINHVHNTQTAIYVSDISSVFKFSTDGIFINRINRQGEGPEEYLNVSDFQIDENNDVWILCRNTHTLYLYSWDNILKKKLSVSLWVENIHLSGDKMYLYTGNEKSETDNNQLHILDIPSGTIVGNFKPVDDYQSKYLFVKAANLFSKGEKDTIAHFHQLFNDTVYQVTSSAVRPEYVFNWGGKNIPKTFYEKDYENIMDFFQHLHAAGSYAYGLNSFLESETSFWVTYFYQGECYCAAVPKKGSGSEVFNRFSVTGLPDDYKVNLSEVSIFSQDNGSFVIPLNAEDIAEPSEQVVEDSNSVLLVVKPD